MTDQNKIWKIQTLSCDNDMKKAIQQQHYAAQYIAMTGRHLIRQEADDSNTNMQFIADKNILAGHALPNGAKLALELNRLEIQLLAKDNTVHKSIPLPGKNRQNAFDAVKKLLTESGIDTANLKNELHYEIPVQDLDNGFLFTIFSKRHFQENTYHRHNAEIVINEIINNFNNAAPLRVWPHHFDTGSFIPLAHNDKGDIVKSMGLGFAIPDEMVDEPYYYLSYWSEKPAGNFNELPEIEAGEWITTGWSGGVLKLSDIVKNKSSEKQYQQVTLFFKSGIQILKAHFK